MLKKKWFSWVVVSLLLFPVAVVTCYAYRDILRQTVELALLPTHATEQREVGNRPTYIAHGGGIAKGRPKTNSLDALEDSYARGYRYFELDFNWTSDGELVAIHDWGESKVNLFGGTVGRLSKREFSESKMHDGLRQMTLDDVAGWLEHDRQDAFIVTDIKEDNLRGLALIAQRHPQLANRFLPQVYRFPQIVQARQLGFERIIMTLYASRYTDAGVLDFVQRQKPFAITMPVDRAETSLPEVLARQGVMTYVHGVNDRDLARRLQSRGIGGFYAGELLPPSNPSINLHVQP